MKAKVLFKNKDWFTVFIEGMPRSVLQELSRHRVDISPSVKSSRYTLKEIKGLSFQLMNCETGVYGKYIYLTGNRAIDDLAHKQLATVAMMLEDWCTNDEVKTLLPEGFVCDATYTMTIDAWNHLYKLRSGKGVYKPFRELVELIKEALEASVTSNANHTPLETAAFAARTCYNSHNLSDPARDRGLIKRVGVQLRHGSILEHLRFSVDIVGNKELFYAVVTSSKLERFAIIGKDTIELNMRTVIEAYNISEPAQQKAIMNSIPEEYRYLLEKES
jgi:thymidylate synthase ThyX